MSEPSSSAPSSSPSSSEASYVCAARAVQLPPVDTLEAATAAASLGVKVVAEPHKCLPRNIMIPGRIRVLLKNADGSKIMSKNQFMLNLCDAIIKMRAESEDSKKKKKSKK
eukprot:TRINITY_DN2463_c0_g1_i1.p1 TRINITY_DN2463_c0_g1~~TRINITY_DN2463_c0_g1_i1.p1  ORF type:complete len:111 (+),score=16.95 TRINITY_DN2463_c0_g1_i1:3-335(+)